MGYEKMQSNIKIIYDLILFSDAKFEPTSIPFEKATYFFAYSSVSSEQSKIKTCSGADINSIRKIKTN